MKKPTTPESVIPDVCNRESSVFKNVFGIRSRSRAVSWRHCPAPAGVAAPRSRNLFGGEDCLSKASSAALEIGTGAKAPPWGHARAPMVLGPFAETKGPRRAGTKPRMRKTNTLDPRLKMSRMTDMIWAHSHSVKDRMPTYNDRMETCGRHNGSAENITKCNKVYNMYKINEIVQNVIFVQFVTNFTKIKFPKKCKKVKNDAKCPR